MHRFLKLFFKESVRAAAVPLFLFGALAVAFAFTEPSVGPAGGTVYAPVNTGGTAQTKSGNFTSSGTVTGNVVNGTSQMCLGGSCISAWPVGGGTVTSVSAGTGMSFPTITTSGSVSLNTSGISSCTNSITNKIYWNGSSLACGTDQTGSGGGAPGGSNGYVQFNSSGSFGGDGKLFWDNSNKRLGIGTTGPQGTLDVEGGNMIVGGGNVGIWTGSPAYALDVGGSGQIRSAGGIGVGVAPPSSPGVAAVANLYSQVNGGKVIGIGELSKAKLDYGSSLIYGAGYDSSSGIPGILIPGYGYLWLTAQSGWAGLAINGPLQVNNSQDSTAYQELFLGGNGAIVSTSCGGCWAPTSVAGDIVVRAQNSGNEVILTIGGTSAYLKIAPNNQVYASGAYNNLSDVRLKTNIVPIAGALEKLNKIRGVTFEWNPLSGNSTDGAHIGVLAQEVEAVFPELVSSDGQTGYKSVDYGGLIAPMIEAIKEQQKEIDSLRARIDALEKK